MTSYAHMQCRELGNPAKTRESPPEFALQL